MSHHHASIRHLLPALALVAGVCAAAPPRALAQVEYRLWFYDENQLHQMGDLTAGSNGPLVPPSWACGLRFYDIHFQRYADIYGGTVDDDDQSEQITVWLDKNGCPPGLTLILDDEEQPLPVDFDGVYPSWLEIWVPEDPPTYGVRWIDADGGWPICGACTDAGEVTDFVKHTHGFYGPLSASNTIAALLLDTRRQSTLGPAVAVLAADTERLRLAVSREIATRRQVPLADLETTVRALEDAALRAAADAKRKFDSSASYARVARYADASIAAAAGRRWLEAAQGLLRELQIRLDSPTR